MSFWVWSPLAQVIENGNVDIEVRDVVVVLHLAFQVTIWLRFTPITWVVAGLVGVQIAKNIHSEMDMKFNNLISLSVFFYERRTAQAFLFDALALVNLAGKQSEATTNTWVFP